MSSFTTKQWFDYTSEMNTVLTTLQKRLFNSERVSQALDRSYSTIGTTMRHQLASQESTHNSIDILSINSDHQSATINGRDPTETLRHSDVENSSVRRIDRLNPMKTRAYEFAAIFTDTFDQLNLIHQALSISKLPKNNNQLQDDQIDSKILKTHFNCNPTVLHQAGIILMNERDKLRYEIEWFVPMLMLLFRTLLLESEKDFQISIDQTYQHLPSRELLDLTNRFQQSEEGIRKLLFIKKHFHTDKTKQFDILNLTKSQLKDQLMEETSRSKIALRYCNDWKKNHVSQWIEMLSRMEGNDTKTMHQYGQILHQTDVAHEQTVRVLTKQNQDMKIDASKWYEYYHNETYRFERELNLFRQEFHQMRRQRERMYEEYQRMKVVVEEYNQMKLNEQLALEKRKREEEAIKRIQAWWKGTMTRQFKQKKKKKSSTSKRSNKP